MRWLTGYQLPGIPLLCHYLAARLAAPEHYRPPTPERLAQVHSVDLPWLCPIQTGSYLLDSLQVTPGARITLTQVGYPLLLLPFLATLSARAERSLHYRYTDQTLHFCLPRLDCHTAADALGATGTTQLTCLFDTVPVTGREPVFMGCEIAQPDIQLLSQSAGKTYVPASALSRQGAGPSD